MSRIRFFVAAGAILGVAFPAIALAAVGGSQAGPHRAGLRPVSHQVRAGQRRGRRRHAAADSAATKRHRFADLPGGVSRGTLDAIASCESGGDPTAVSSDGTYRGKYQFDYGTWASVGGHGDPAQASESEQDYRAALLYERAGSSPWPICGS